jgi:hypothetical protein
VLSRPADGYATRLTREQRAELRLRIDAYRREILHRQRFSLRLCPGCGQWLHRSEFGQGGGVCRLCLGIGERGSR